MRNKFDAIVFDVDSTLVKIEGLDWLAAYKGKGQEVVYITKKSMEGLLNFNESMIHKMRLISPSFQDLEKLGEIYCRNVVPGAKEVIQVFMSLGIEVWILTGNFDPAVGILADYLGIPRSHVICNKIFFGPSGEYLGFDSKNELSQNGGKAKMIKLVKDAGNKRIVFVGDGVTDIELKNEVSLFVGFGGVSERDVVKKNSDYYISKLSLSPLLKIILDM